MEIRKFRSIGLMSGTSCDGLDICYCHFTWNGEKWEFKILAGETIPYSPEWIRRLKSAHELNGRDLILFHKELGRFFGIQTKEFIQRHHILKLDFIASHGHTVYHEPKLGLNFQAGDGHCIAAETACPTVFDFRSLDIALGGQGAPFVPIGDRYLFSDYDACLNLGGISNISFERAGQIFAFDISPFNILLNNFSQRMGYPFDDKGQLARSGSVNRDVVEQLNKLDYFKRSSPKSLSRELIDSEYSSVLENHTLTEMDWLRSLIEHYVIQISDVFENNRIKNILLSGGGVYNSFFVEELSKRTNTQLIIPDKMTIDFKEALLFAFLGCLKKADLPNVFSSVTGASRDSISGLEVRYNA